MKKLIAKLEDLMVAITFAESGEYEDALRYSGDKHTEEEEAVDASYGMKHPVYESKAK